MGVLALVLVVGFLREIPYVRSLRPRSADIIASVADIATITGGILLVLRVRHGLSLSAIGIHRTSAMYYALWGVRTVVIFWLPVIVLRCFYVVVAHPESHHFRSPWDEVVHEILLFTAAPFGEEMLFRAFLYAPACTKLGPTGAVVLSSIMWAVSHTSTLFGLLSIRTIVVFLFGLILGILYRRTRSIWPGFSLHAAWNFSLTVVAVESVVNNAVVLSLMTVAMVSLVVGWSYIVDRLRLAQCSMRLPWLG